MRTSRWSVSLTSILAAVAACGGGDLTLPGSAGPASLTIVSGNEQQDLVGNQLKDPLVVRLTDAAGQPAPGIMVTFRFVGGASGARVDPDTGTTDGAGHTFTRARLGDTEGVQQIEARVVESANPVLVQFQATALPKKGDGGPREGGGDGGHGGGEGGGGGDGDD